MLIYVDVDLVLISMIYLKYQAYYIIIGQISFYSTRRVNLINYDKSCEQLMIFISDRTKLLLQCLLSSNW